MPKVYTRKGKLYVKQEDKKRGRRATPRLTSDDIKSVTLKGRDQPFVQFDTVVDAYTKISSDERRRDDLKTTFF